MVLPLDSGSLQTLCTYKRNHMALHIKSPANAFDRFKQMFKIMYDLRFLYLI